MAKGKVHKFAGEVTPPGEAPRALVLCMQKHRPLLPLQHSEEWRAVTCVKCLKHRPARSMWQRLLGWFGGGR